jgi:hypothetical protein
MKFFLLVLLLIPLTQTISMKTKTLWKESTKWDENDNLIKSKEFTIENRLTRHFGKCSINKENSFNPDSTSLILEIKTKHYLTIKHSPCTPEGYLGKLKVEECKQININYDNVIYIVAQRDRSGRSLLRVYYKIPDNPENRKNYNSKIITITIEFSFFEPKMLKENIINKIPPKKLEKIYEKRNTFLDAFNKDFNALDSNFWEFYKDKKAFNKKLKKLAEKDKKIEILSQHLTWLSGDEGHPSHIFYQIFREKLKIKTTSDFRDKALKAFKIMDDAVNTSVEFNLSSSTKEYLKDFSRSMNNFIKLEYLPAFGNKVEDFKEEYDYETYMKINRVYELLNTYLDKHEQLRDSLNLLREAKFNINNQFYKLMKTCYEISCGGGIKIYLDSNLISVYQIAQLHNYLANTQSEEAVTTVDKEYQSLKAKHGFKEPQEEGLELEKEEAEDVNEEGGEVHEDNKASQQLILV